MTGGDEPKDGLDDDWKDKLLAIGKGAVGAVPFVGGLIGEVVGVAIPGLRADRVATYLRALDARVEELETGVKEGLTSDAEKIDLIEKGGVQAARATSKERIERIVDAVSRGLSADDADIVRRKRLLSIFGELDDDEVSILNAYGEAYGSGGSNAFQKLDVPNRPHMQSSPEEFDKHELFEAGEAHLVRLGLLQKNYGNVSRGQSPEFDKNKGDFKHRLEISPLGRMLLREIGLETEFDARQRRRIENRGG